MAGAGHFVAALHAYEGRFSQFVYFKSPDGSVEWLARYQISVSLACPEGSSGFLIAPARIPRLCKLSPHPGAVAPSIQPRLPCY